MSSLAGARCVGQHELFESTDYRDHLEARAICADCPAIAACLDVLRDVQAVSRTMTRCGGGPSGTWAGVLYGVSDKPRRGRQNPREHGTQRGYDQHRWHKEPICDECKAAHRVVLNKAFGGAQSAQVNPTIRTPVRVESGAESGPESARTDRGLPITQLRT